MSSLHSSHIPAAMLVLTLWTGLAQAQSGTAMAVPAQQARENLQVSAVSGESWLTHLNRPFNDTSMGKTNHLGPASWEAEPAAATPEDPLPPAAGSMRTLHGRDIFRINCQGCHGETGEGAPPEINSVINPVRATSVPLVMARLKALGMAVRRSDAESWARNADGVLLQRLHDGGEEMPPFHHLGEAEVGALHNYLKALAGVPGAEAEQIAITVSALHVGEQIVKSTCHTCHSATGANPTPQQLLDGAIPPLSTLLARKNKADFIGKVIFGAPVVMGAEPAVYRGRMPVFDYLTAEEEADAYAYLQLYPPVEAAGADKRQTSSPRGFAGTSEKPSPPGVAMPPLTANREPAEIAAQRTGADTRTVTALAMVVMLVSALLVLGAWITIREFRKLSARSAGFEPIRQDRRHTPEDESVTLQDVA